MKTMTIVVVAAGICLLPMAAWADPPPTANVLQIGLGFRYGVSMNNDIDASDVNPWGPGLGASVGYTLPMGVYAGGNFDYFFGGEGEGGLISGRFKSNIWQLMAEGGYDVGLGDSFVIRPKVGLGPAGISSEFCPTGMACQSDSKVYFALAPGATFMLLTSHFKLSVDLRYDLIFAESTTAKGLIFSLGIGF